MYCTHCNYENESSSKFCEKCGKSLNEALSDTQPIHLRKAKGTQKITLNTNRNLAVFSGLALLAVVLGLLVFGIVMIGDLMPIEFLSKSSNNTSETSTISSNPIKIIPVQKIQELDGDGWEKTSINFAVANLSSEWRRFGTSGKYMASISSKESRQESVDWSASLQGPTLLIPPGFILRDRSDIKSYSGNLVGKIPQNMTGIELRIPYYEDTWSIGQKVDGYYIFDIYNKDETALVLMDSDYTDLSNISFPVMAPNLVRTFNFYDQITLEETKLSVTVVKFEHMSDVNNSPLVVKVEFKNDNLVDKSDYRIFWYGAGDDGIVRNGILNGKTSGCNVNGVSEHFYLNPEISLGPGQKNKCSFSFPYLGKSKNKYVWFVLIRDKIMYNQAVIYLGD